MEKQIARSSFTDGHVTDIAGRNFLVDHEANRISFLDARFYRTAAGEFVPSVTTILEAYPKGAQYYEWLKKHGEDSDTIRDEAGRRGSVVHEATEVLDLGGELSLMNGDGSPRYRINEWAMISRYAEFREMYPGAMHAVETKLASSDLGYAGTLDRVFTFTINGKTYLYDIKTSGGIWPSYWLQQAAYHELLHRSGAIAQMFPDGEVPTVHLAILWLNARTRGVDKKGKAIQGQGWQFVEQEHSTAHYLDLFNKTHALWLAENAGQQPKQLIYRLKHKL